MKNNIGQQMTRSLSRMRWAFSSLCGVPAVLVFMAILIIQNTIIGQPSNQQLSAVFNDYVRAMMTEDVQAIIDMTPPSVLRLMGDDDFIKKDIVGEWNMYKEIGLSLVTLHLVELAPVVHSDKAEQSLIQYTTQYQNNELKVNENGFVLAIKYGDTEWFLLDLKKYDPESLAVFVPEVDESIIQLWQERQ